MGRDTFHYTRFFKATCGLALNTAREGTFTISVGNLFQCLITLIVNNFFPISNLNLPAFSLKPLPFFLSLYALVKSPLQLAWSFLASSCSVLHQPAPPHTSQQGCSQSILHPACIWAWDCPNPGAGPACPWPC